MIEPSQECVKFNYVTSINKCHAGIILTAIILHEGPRIISKLSGFKCIHLVSQVFTELPLVDSNFETNYNPGNLGVSASEKQVVYKFSKGHSVKVKS